MNLNTTIFELLSSAMMLQQQTIRYFHCGSLVWFTMWWGGCCVAPAAECERAPEKVLQNVCGGSEGASVCGAAHVILEEAAAARGRGRWQQAMVSASRP